MSRMDHVVSWRENPLKTGQQKMAPVLCSDVIASYEVLVRALCYGRDLTDDELKLCAYVLKKENDRELASPPELAEKVAPRSAEPDTARGVPLPQA